MYTEFDEIIKKFKNENIVLPDQWWDDKKVEFIYSSNKLEGNRLSLAATYSVLNDKMNFGDDARFKDVLEVKGHIKALDGCVFMAKNNYPLTTKIIKTFNANLLSALWKFDEFYTNWKENKQELGEYKILHNSIKFLLDGKDGVIEPVSNVKSVNENMESVLSDSKALSHLLDRVAFLAFQIWLNQPFPDANKRTARLVVAYLLMVEGLPLISFKADGYHFNEGLLRSYTEKNLKPLIKVIEAEVNQQLTEIMEMNTKLKQNKKPPHLGAGGTLLF